VYMAPLRERIEDLPMLISHYVGVLNVQFHQNITGMDQALQERLTQYAWPGNVRELRNLLEAAYVNQPYETIRFEDLPEHFRRKSMELREAPGAMSERHLLLNTLNATHWNKSRAAEKLHWSRVTLYRKLAKHGIADRPESAEVSGV
jgi:DNA-binding NtrC family response regulator